MRSKHHLVFLALLAGAGACADPTLVTYEHELAHPGGWDPPQELLDKADTFQIENVQAGTWIGEAGCGGQFLEGTQVLRDWIYEHWPQVTYIGGYSCRKIANSNQMSVHATGRALDLMLPTDSSQPRDESADNDLGDALANWLLENADELGIQLIIWDNMIWSSSRSPGERFRVYTNEHKHHDHIHMELNPAGAALDTPWFDGPMGPPELPPCGEPLSGDGGIVDDTDPCVEFFGPAEYWRVEEGVGHGGSLRWTNAFESDVPSNWARWNLHFAETGRYRVDYHSVAQWAVFGSTQYRVRYGDVDEDIVVDLSAGEDGWQPLGEYEFVAGQAQSVSVFDNAPVAVASEQHVLADAIRLVRVDPMIDNPDPPDEPNVPDGTGGPPIDDDEGAREPAPDADADADGPEVVDGRGGCGCTTSGAAPDANVFLLVLGFAALRRRRLSRTPG